MSSEAVDAGRSVGRYHLHRELAKGGMARIHLARALGDEGFSRFVAAKRLNPELASDPEFVEMFLDEARVASKVRHRNVVTVLDVVTIDGEVVIVQELVHGAPLHKLFVRAGQTAQRIPVDIAVSIATQILAGLHAVHEAVDETGARLNIVHRDVSPQNIMIASDGTARLLDFGVAKASATAHITRAGTFKGKVPYSSPEQLFAKTTRQTDVYALGIVLWELLVGCRMHGGFVDAEIYKRILEQTPMPITKALANQRRDGRIDDTSWRRLVVLEPIIERALARDLTVRFATAEAMERALAAAVPPAQLVDVATWMRELAPDVLQRTAQLIAEEEASWRLARGSGCGPAVKADGTPGPMPPVDTMRLEAAAFESETESIGTEPAKPSAIVWAKQTLELAVIAERRRRDTVRFVDAVLLALLVLLWAATASRPDATRTMRMPVATLSPALPVGPAHPLAIATPAPAAASTAQPSPQRARSVGRTAHASAKQPPRKRVAGPRPSPPKSGRTAYCAIPFYYQGTRKVFKPGCI